MVGNTAGPFIPGKWEDVATAQFRSDAKAWVKMVQEANALNKRFSQGELNQLEDMAGNPEKFFKSPEMFMATVDSINRRVINVGEANRAKLEGRDSWELQRMPTGYGKDAFDARNPAHAEYIKRAYKSGADLRGISIIDKSGNPSTWEMDPVKQQ